MSSGVERHVLDRLAAARIEREPFAHCVIDGIFPDEFFEEVVDNWPASESFVSIAETGRVTGVGAGRRHIIRFLETDLARLSGDCHDFWSGQVGSWLMGAAFNCAVLRKFAAEVQARLPAGIPAFKADALIVSDQTAYAIGPHTDAPHRLVSLLFYLPEDATFRRFGTSLYLPKDRSFRCPGGPHHDFDGFERVKTIEFLPNRLVAFPKTDACFHGVERVDLPGIERRLLIHNVRVRG